MNRVRTSLPVACALVALALLGTPAGAQWSVSTPLTQARQDPAVVEVAGQVLIAGGRAVNSLFATVDIYDDASGRWSTASLSVARTNLAATSVGPYALFAGGSTSFTSSTNVIDVYDSGTGTWSTVTLGQARYDLSAVTVGGKAIFAGGATGGPGTAVPSAFVDIYDSSVGPPNDPLAWSTTSLGLARGNMGAAAAGDCAVFAGGLNGMAVDNVDIYCASTGTWSTTTLSQPRMPKFAAVGVGTKVYIAGGLLNPGIPTDLIEIYDTVTGVWSQRFLSSPRVLFTATAFGNTIFFAGGTPNLGAQTPVYDVVEVLDATTDTWEPPMSLSQARCALGAARVGNKILFAGGNTGPSPSAVVDIYEPEVFVRGDTNGDGTIDLADTIHGLSYLFANGPSTCLPAHDLNDDGILDIGDPIYGLSYQFTAGAAPPAPFPGCGLDPTPDPLDAACPGHGSCP